MKKLTIIALVLLVSVLAQGQQTGYYNGTDGKSGEELKTALNNIIKGHTQYSYYFSKEIFKISDADPENPSNVIQVYTGFSHSNSDYGNSSLQLNREHVWAKSHGDFADIPPMYGDVHNLKPAAASVNQSKSNLDFDNGGEQHAIATDCYYTDSTWEARDEVKGDIARIIFYMSTRYEGNDGEMDLEVVDKVNTYPLAEHGKLSTLLQWNLQDPPDEFERNRNNTIYTFQKNRNPFIDDPNFAALIWGDAIPNSLIIDNVQISPQVAVAEQPVSIQATIKTASSRATSAKLFWGLSYDNRPNEITMTNSGDVFSADIPGQAEDAIVYYNIVATDTEMENASVVYNYYIPKIFTGTIVSIYDIQGQQADSPYEDQVVSTTGVVTANFGTYYFIQDGPGAWNGLFIYESGRNPSIGDSIVITGEIAEYSGNDCTDGKTEMLNIEDYYFISANNELPEPVVVQTGSITEEYESVLAKVVNATCTDANYQADYYMWKVNDGSGMVKIHNTSVFEFEPTEGFAYNITGPLNWDYCEWKIELRFESDVAEGSDLEKPTVAEVMPLTTTSIQVSFSENVDPLTAEDISNYLINNGITVESAMQHQFNKTEVFLTVTGLMGDYELTVQNVEDPSGNVMEPQTIPFSYVGIEELLSDGNVSVYPNPATDRLNISFDSKDEFGVIVYMTDILGKQLLYDDYFANQGVNKLTYDLKSFEPGIYFLSLIGEKATLNYKVIVR